MTREEIVKALFLADTAIMAILVGGVYTDQELGVEGLRRGEDSPCDAAFDDKGNLLTCAVIRQSGENPYGDVRNIHDKFSGMSQMVFVYFFERRGHENVDLAKIESYRILEGVRLGRSYPIWMVSESGAIPDGGPVTNSTMLVQSWMVVYTRQSA